MSVTTSKETQIVSQKASIIQPGVEFVGIVNNRGKLVDFLGTKPLDISNDKKNMWLMGFALINSMQKDFDEDFGGVNYNVTERKNSKIISIPTANCHTIIAITKKNTNPENIISGIKQLVEHSEQFLNQKISGGEM